ncbi:hypothetical protein Ccrd_022169 [Cynara cardunculus var. scolymus]|uniref:ABC1 atypical kinase-like domain-containing protein n=1 Tax=Cynara cardunculus var. scolymus TaxID=59895 RepID=A0A103XZ96_CYNCS|nr:hypothetical protein Ccrd_022169 [Cynara cardunculus var. scolymus]
MMLAPAPPPPALLPPALYSSARQHLRWTAVNFVRSTNLLRPRTAVAAIGRDVDTFTESSGYLFELSTSEAESLTDYNISKIASIYRKKPFIVLRRLLQIVNTLGKWLALRYLDGITERSNLMFEVRASQLRQILVKLGPVCIYKNCLGYLISTYRISPFSTEVAFRTIEKELGAPLDQLFTEISPEPMAAASLGQVYQARLRDTGQIVAVKVQRPGVQAAISLDILILHYLAGLVRRAGKFNTDLQVSYHKSIAVVDEWASSLFRESVPLIMIVFFGNHIECRRWITLMKQKMELGSEYAPAISGTCGVIVICYGYCLLLPEPHHFLLPLVGSISIVKKPHQTLLNNPHHAEKSLISFALCEPTAEQYTTGYFPLHRCIRELYGSLKDVLVPDMYIEKTTRKVLTMQWMEGQKLSEVKDLYLVEIGVYCSFNQLLEYGFYHADPHPGNLLRTYDGKLAYLASNLGLVSGQCVVPTSSLLSPLCRLEYAGVSFWIAGLGVSVGCWVLGERDYEKSGQAEVGKQNFGMMGDFKQELRDGFIEACLHLINRDYDALAKDFVTLGLLPATADKDAVTKALTGVFQNAVAKGVRNISFGDLLGNLGTTMYKFKFQIPSYFSLVIRSLAVLEGIAINSDPNYKVLGGTYPWIARKVLTDSSPQLRSSLQALLYEVEHPEYTWLRFISCDSIHDGVFRIDRLESLLSESLRARTEKALVKVEDNNSDVVIKQILSFTLTEKGAFVREILLQEFAKGLDALGIASLESLTSAATANIPFAPSPSPIADEDITNLRNLHRLLQLLSGSQKMADANTGVEEFSPYTNKRTTFEEISLVFNQLTSIQDKLPLLNVVTELPPDLQQQLIRLPVDLVGKLVSRVAARTIRRALL